MITGRVQNVSAQQKLVFVDVLPGVVGVCHISELDYERIDRIEEYAAPGEIAAFQVLTVGRDDMTLTLSRKRAHGHTPRPLPSLVPGGRAFELRANMPYFESLRRRRGREPSARNRVRVLSMPAPATPTGPTRTALADHVETLEAELRAANEELANLVEQLRQARTQLQDARKVLRSVEDRHEAARKGMGLDDPLASQRAFLLAVRMAHARMFDATYGEVGAASIQLHPGGQSFVVRCNAAPHNIDPESPPVGYNPATGEDVWYFTLHDVPGSSVADPIGSVFQYEMTASPRSVSDPLDVGRYRSVNISSHYSLDTGDFGYVHTIEIVE